MGENEVSEVVVWKGQKGATIKKSRKKILFLNSSRERLVVRAEVLSGCRGPGDLQSPFMRNSPAGSSPSLCQCQCHPASSKNQKKQQNQAFKLIGQNDRNPTPAQDSLQIFCSKMLHFLCCSTGTPQSPTKVNSNSRRITLSVPGSF